MGPKDFETGAQQRLNEKVPADEIGSASSRLADELLQLAERPLASKIWPLSYYRNRRYRGVLASYCEILPILDQPENRGYVIPALIGLRHLKEKNFSVASEIIRTIRFHIVSGEAITYVMRGLLYFVCGLLLVGNIILALVHTTSPGGVDRSVVKVFLSFFFGLLGSVVSLLSRISEFEQIGTRSRAYFTYIGATSPIVGGIVAAVIAALIQSKLISIAALDLTDNYWIFIVSGFLSGFSERFSGNLLEIAQGRISGSGEQRSTISGKPLNEGPSANGN